MADSDAKAMNTKQTVHLKDLSNAERRAFLDSFDRVFCDCDGVIWEPTQKPIPGSGKAISFLQSLGKEVVFVTNNSLRSAEAQLSKFRETGISVTKEQLIHPAQSIVNYLNDRNFEGLIYCIASGAFKKTLTSAGFNLIDGPNRMLDETLKDLCANVFQNDPVKAVVIDVDFNLSVAKLMRAYRYLKNPDCLFIGGAADLLIPIGTEDVLGPGSFIHVVEQAAKRKATMLGKPGRDLCDVLIKQCNVVDPGRALFIGDILDSDVKFGKMCGFKTMLVLTGWTKENELLGELSEGETPDYCVDSLADLNDFV